jgi:DNA-binding MarR family transcriptional regulator
VNRNVMVLEIDGLEKRGYLRRERKRENRREQAIVLTAKGRHAVRAIEKLMAENERDLLRPATVPERAALVRWARAVIEHDAYS